ncbi:MAG: VOC family protein [Acidimicrobiales bacterium]|nr:VOC family protein [Acidimicrobiales bacterium]
MVSMTSYAHGVPSWTDLATPDPEASKAFYGELFGWTYDDQATDQPGTDYTMCAKGDAAAAGMMKLSDEMAAQGMPPVWTTYVSVDDLEAAVAKVGPAGGAVMQPPMDVMDAGRMAVLADPAGAVFCLWEAKDHIGAEVVNETGALSWNELISTDLAGVLPFYGEVLGWTSQAVPMPNGEYTLIQVEGGNPDGIAGAMPPPMEGMPSFWGVYFMVDDAAATVARAKELGATAMMEATPFPGVGTLAALADPHGAMFSIMQPEA